MTTTSSIKNELLITFLIKLIQRKSNVPLLFRKTNIGCFLSLHQPSFLSHSLRSQLCVPVYDELFRQQGHYSVHFNPITILNASNPHRTAQFIKNGK